MLRSDGSQPAPVDSSTRRHHDDGELQRYRSSYTSRQASDTRRRFDSVSSTYRKQQLDYDTFIKLDSRKMQLIMIMRMSDGYDHMIDELDYYKMMAESLFLRRVSWVGVLYPIFIGYYWQIAYRNSPMLGLTRGKLGYPFIALFAVPVATSLFTRYWSEYRTSKLAKIVLPKYNFDSEIMKRFYTERVLQASPVKNLSVAEVINDSQNDKNN